MADDVKSFIKRFDVLTIALSWMVGFTCKDMLLAFLDGVAYPLIEVLVPKQWWDALVFQYNGVSFDIANIIFRTIDFTIAFGIMFVIVMIILPKSYTRK
jgi:large-conductance mechanosensitive channel